MASWEDAGRLDMAIDALLRQPPGPRSSSEDELRATARLLRDGLPRYHPRFGFEELLSARLAAAGRAGAAAVGVGPSRPTRLDSAAHAATRAARRRGGPAGYEAASAEPRSAIREHPPMSGQAVTSTHAATRDDTAAAAVERRRRGLVAGGAIASGVSLAIPIAGAAIVAWRRSRSSGGIL